MGGAVKRYAFRRIGQEGAREGGLKPECIYLCFARGAWDRLCAGVRGKSNSFLKAPGNGATGLHFLRILGKAVALCTYSKENRRRERSQFFGEAGG